MCDRDTFALIWIDLLDRKLVMKDGILPFAFKSMRELIILVLEIVSKAFIEAYTGYVFFVEEGVADISFQIR